MDVRDERDDEEQLPEHERRPEEGVGAGTDPSGTNEEAGATGADGEQATDFDAEDVPPVTRSG